MQESIKERPILFSAPMVRALLDGSKTQTRRIVKPLKDPNFGVQLAPCEIAGEVNKSGRIELCPYGKVGDRLWVRETWMHTGTGVWSIKDVYAAYDGAFSYRADGSIESAKYWPSIHMPRIASRINLEITGVRVERLNDISADDAEAEGIEVDPEPWDQTIAFKDYSNDGWIPKWGRRWETAEIESFKSLWESINGEGSWAANPWVWVVEFKVIK